MVGTNSKPTNQIKAFKWETKDAHVKSWLLQTIDPSILVNLRPYKTVKAIWDYLKKVYVKIVQPNNFNLNMRCQITHKEIC
uniref:Retrotransposon Copia-like N-terminal domain-containing protein n=1 Tax=Manihot esculenta TaxID=3983 RepID=A0A2C9W076_MANES